MLKPTRCRGQRLSRVSPARTRTIMGTNVCTCVEHLTDPTGRLSISTRHVKATLQQAKRCYVSAERTSRCPSSLSNFPCALLTGRHLPVVHTSHRVSAGLDEQDVSASLTLLSPLHRAIEDGRVVDELSPLPRCPRSEKLLLLLLLELVGGWCCYCCGGSGSGSAPPPGAE